MSCSNHSYSLHDPTYEIQSNCIKVCSTARTTCRLLVHSRSCWWRNLSGPLQRKAGWGLRTKPYCACYINTCLCEVMYQTITVIPTFLYVKQQKLYRPEKKPGKEASIYTSMYTDYRNYAWWLRLFLVKRIYTWHKFSNVCVTTVAALARLMAA